MKPEVASRRIESFGQRFGEAHLYLAYHAAFPLALTPDLLYRLWANFQRDINGEVLIIPWMAVADLLLSSLCDEVGHELYEMDTAVRNALLRELKQNRHFGEQRINELSDFLLTYVRQQIESHNPDIRDFAQAQRWTALAYTRPSEAARELASILAGLKLEDKAELSRMASLIETLAEPLVERGFEPLVVSVRRIKEVVRNRSGGVAIALSQQNLNLNNNFLTNQEEITSIPNKLIQPFEMYTLGEKIEHNENQIALIDNKLSQRYIELDPGGYFIIYLDRSAGLIYSKHFANIIDEKGLAVDPESGKVIPAYGQVQFTHTTMFSGRTAKELCVEIFEETQPCPVTQLDHAAYLGREFMRAEMALITGQEYIQD